MNKRWLPWLAVILLCASLLIPVWAQSDDDDDPEQTREEVSIGRKASSQFERHAHVVKSGPAVDRLKRILKKLGAASGRKLPYSVKVVEEPHVNAITFPGGLIYVYRGLLNQSLTEDMLANVMAHEVVHAARSHGYRTLLQMKALGALTGGQDSLVSGMSKILLISGVGRTYENQADRIGIHVAAKAGYNPRGMLSVMQLLQRLSRDNPGLITGLVATHPPTAVRIKKIQDELKRLTGSPPAR